MDYVLRYLKRTAEATGSAEDWQQYARALERNFHPILPFTPSPDNVARWILALRVQFDEWVAGVEPLYDLSPRAYLLHFHQSDPLLKQSKHTLNALIVLDSDDPRTYLDDFHIVHIIDAMLVHLGESVRSCSILPTAPYQYDSKLLLQDTDGHRVLLLIELVIDIDAAARNLEQQ